MGLTEIPDEDTLNIDVWLATGRDQSQIWRTMIDANSGFTQSTGTAVSLKLVTGGTLLPSILSRKGPDVYLGLGAADVINYAIREAVLGISGNVSEERMSAQDNAIFTTPYYSYAENGTVTVNPEGFMKQTESVLNCRESGSTLRFFIPLALCLGKRITLQGSKRLFERPLDVYEKLCADNGFEFEKGENSVTLCGKLESGKCEIRGVFSLLQLKQVLRSRLRRTQILRKKR